MNTEHVFQIAVSVDDEAIQKATIEHCAKEVARCLDNGFFKRGYNNRVELDYRMTDVIKERVDAFLESHKDEFLKLVVADVGERLNRSKKFKDSVVEKVGAEYADA